ncbi:glycosyltransferase family 4 protein [Sphingomonas faeni]|uniref:glycosyltransferase family 4 protein n=1 Tax=Sphingomonas faeni TaxID=185950 RepID=UPI0024136E6E|nr:glycosyltransferase family 4 protein [Sphingomonas faeni]
MKIGYFTNQYPKISHSFIRREIIALEDLGIDVTRWAIRGWDAELADPSDKEELKRTRYILGGGVIPLLTATASELVRAPKRWLKALSLSLKMMKRSDRSSLLHLISFFEACHLAKSMRTLEIKHLHVHFGTNAAEIAMISSAISSIPYSLTVHGPGEFDAPTGMKLNLKITHAAFVIAISEYCASQLYRWAKISDWTKINIVHCGLSDVFFDEDIKPIRDIPHFVNIGRLDPEKGHLVLVEAIARLRDRGTPAHVTIVGDGVLRGEIQNSIERLGVADYVTLAGWASEAQVRDHIIASRAMVMPTFAEGLPVVLMEALALGRPLLASNVAAIAELVIPDKTGWLFAAGSVDAVAAAMAECMAAPIEVCAQMGEAGKSLVRERHNASVEARKVYNLIVSNTQKGNAGRERAELHDGIVCLASSDFIVSA